MPVEPAIYVNTLDPAYPTSGEPKGQGDNHLRLIKQVLKNTFPQFTGPLPIAHDQVASKDYVMQTAFSSSLPGQTGNTGKVLTTDGTNASWQPGLPVQTGNGGSFLTTDGTASSWGSKLNAGVIRFADGTDATKLAAFDFAGLATGTTRTYTFPPAGGPLALKTDLPPPFPVLIVREERPAGTNGGTFLVGENTRSLNSVVKNTISGALLNGSAVTVPAGTYRITGDAAAKGASTAQVPHKAYLVNGANVIVLLGTAEFAAVGAVSRSEIDGQITFATETTFTLRHANGGGIQVDNTGLGQSVNFSSTAEVYAQLTIEKIA